VRSQKSEELPRLGRWHMYGAHSLTSLCVLRRAVRGTQQASRGASNLSELAEGWVVEHDPALDDQEESE